MDSSLSPPPPPPGMNYIAAIRPGINLILLVTPLSTVVVVIMLMLLFFSSPTSRRHPVFWLNIFTCCLGVVLAVLNGVIEVQQMVAPLEGTSRALYMIMIVFTCASPIIIDTVLLTRVIAFCTHSRRKLVLTVAFPVVCKIARVVTNVVYLRSLYIKMHQFQNVVLTSEVMWFRDPFPVTEWTLQACDNMYCSVFFLYHLRLFDKRSRSGWVIRHRTILSRLRGLFYIALGNFVFPIAINIALIILVVSDRSWLTGGYLQLANVYISIIGLAFATVWTMGHKRSSAMAAEEGSTWNQNTIGGHPGHEQGRAREKVQGVDVELGREQPVHVHVEGIFSTMAEVGHGFTADSELWETSGSSEKKDPIGSSETV